jgi:telomere length regulation protein
MMVVEEVASLSGKKLDFGGWDGKEDWAVWVRDLRALGKGKDVDAADSVGVEDVFETENASKDGPPPSLPSSSTKKASATPKPPPTYDSDDSLTGYISSPSSSRSPSPTPSDLDAIEKDPSLRTGAKKKPHRPVYLYSLGELLKAQKGEAEGDIDRIEMGLKEAEGLIRRKSGFGSELGELYLQQKIGMCAHKGR